MRSLLHLLAALYEHVIGQLGVWISATIIQMKCEAAMIFAHGKVPLRCPLCRATDEKAMCSSKRQECDKAEEQ